MCTHSKYTKENEKEGKKKKPVKKLRQILFLEWLLAKGEQLGGEQMARLARKAELLAAIQAAREDPVTATAAPFELCKWHDVFQRSYFWPAESSKCVFTNYLVEFTVMTIEVWCYFSGF